MFVARGVSPVCAVGGANVGNGVFVRTGVAVDWARAVCVNPAETVPMAAVCRILKSSVGVASALLPVHALSTRLKTKASPSRIFKLCFILVLLIGALFYLKIISLPANDSSTFNLLSGAV